MAHARSWLHLAFGEAPASPLAAAPFVSNGVDRDRRGSAGPGHLSSGLWVFLAPDCAPQALLLAYLTSPASLSFFLATLSRATSVRLPAGAQETPVFPRSPTGRGNGFLQPDARCPAFWPPLSLRGPMVPLGPAATLDPSQWSTSASARAAHRLFVFPQARFECMRTSVVPTI